MYTSIRARRVSIRFGASATAAWRSRRPGACRPSSSRAPEPPSASRSGRSAFRRRPWRTSEPPRATGCCGSRSRPVSSSRRRGPPPRAARPRGGRRDLGVVGIDGEREAKGVGGGSGVRRERRLGRFDVAACLRATSVARDGVVAALQLLGGRLDARLRRRRSGDGGRSERPARSPAGCCFA